MGIAAVTAACYAFTAPAWAGVANAGVPGAPAANPTAGLPWGNYTGSLDEVFPAYNAAGGLRKRLLGLIALRPLVRWFGSWYPDATAESVARDYIDNDSAGGRSRRARALAARLVDGYLWLGRPWLDNQNDPFELQRSLALARTSPFS